MLKYRSKGSAAQISSVHRPSSISFVGSSVTRKDGFPSHSIKQNTARSYADIVRSSSNPYHSQQKISVSSRLSWPNRNSGRQSFSGNQIRDEHGNKSVNLSAKISKFKYIPIYSVTPEAVAGMPISLPVCVSSCTRCLATGHVLSQGLSRIRCRLCYNYGYISESCLSRYQRQQKFVKKIRDTPVDIIPSVGINPQPSRSNLQITNDQAEQLDAAPTAIASTVLDLFLSLRPLTARNNSETVPVVSMSQGFVLLYSKLNLARDNVDANFGPALSPAILYDKLCSEFLPRLHFGPDYVMALTRLLFNWHTISVELASPVAKRKWMAINPTEVMQQPPSIQV